MKNKLIMLLAGALVLLQSCTKKENPAAVKNVAKKNSWILGEPLVNGTYKLINNGSGKSLDVTNASSANGALIQQWDYISPNLFFPNAQKWTITKVDATYYRVINANSGKALDVPGGASTQDLQLQQWDYYGVDSELWKIEHVGLGVYKFINKATGLAMTVHGGSTASGTKVTQKTYAGNGSQYWTPTQVAYKETATTNFFRRESGVVSMDGGNSIRLTDGRTLWLFGDSYMNNYDAATGTIPCGLFQVRNSAVLQPASASWNWALSPTLPGSLGTNTYFYQTQDTNPAYSTQVLNGFQQGDTVYVYTLNYHTNFPDTHSWAKIRVSDMTVVSYKLLQDFAGVSYGEGYIKDVASGYYYAYGSKQDTNALGNPIWPQYVARFPISNPNALWSFWNGSSWVSNAAAAIPIFTGDSFSTNFYKVGSKYISLSTELSLGCDNGDGIQVRVSSSPTGPFSAIKTVYNIEDRRNGHIPFFYGANMHPQYINSNNEILITYNTHKYCDILGNCCVAPCTNNRQNPDEYRPKSIRVPLSMIDPSFN